MSYFLYLKYVAFKITPAVHNIYVDNYISVV